MEKTNGKSDIKGNSGDHLHIRGENLNGKLRQNEKRGSPPHTWRKHTYVEKTNGKSDIKGNSGDHLHIRGENLNGKLRQNEKRGSPPHTWRKHTGKIVANASIRITSTYVEKTLKESHR